MSTGKAATAAESAPDASPEQGKQSTSGADCDAAWLKEMRGRVVTVRLTDGKGITGKLVDYGRYAVTVRVGDEKRARLIWKHAISYVMEQTQ
jgi:sRNA-binding regulator protein Hfq